MKDLYISVDIEANGPIPGIYDMVSFGAYILDTKKTFYRELKLVTGNIVQEAEDVHGLTSEHLAANGYLPTRAMEEFSIWIHDNTPTGYRPVFVGFNAAFDWSFINYYFHKYLDKNPFGISGIDIKSYYMGMENTEFGQTRKKMVRRFTKLNAKHTHNAKDDAIEQGEIFAKLLEINESN